MEKDITVNELADALLKLAKIKYHYPAESAMAFSYGTLTGLFESARWGFNSVQEIVDRKYSEIMKEIEAA
jgi:hypothetical protein